MFDYAAAMRGTVPRPLTDREEEILRFLLSAPPGPGEGELMTDLLRQLDDLSVVEQWDCCPSVDFAVGGERPAKYDEAGPIVDATHRVKPYDLLLFVTTGGRLRTLEIVHYNDDELTEIPAAAEFGPPRTTTQSVRW